jgi:hypothetical protein
VRSWRTALVADTPATLLAKHGVPGLLLAGATLCGKLAGISYTHNSHLQLEAALLGSKLASSVFVCSVTHPQRALDFADYTPVAIWEGPKGSLFNDPYALNAPDVADGLESISGIAVEGGHQLEALPVMALWEWVCTHATRDAAAVVRTRIVRARALCDLGLLREAFDVTTSLMTGSGLPDPLGGGGIVHKRTDGTPCAPARAPCFHPGKFPGDSKNLPAVAYLCRGSVDMAVAAHLGAWAVARVTLARCQLLHALGRVPCAWTETHWEGGRQLVDEDTSPEKVRIPDLRQLSGWGSLIQHLVCMLGAALSTRVATGGAFTPRARSNHAGTARGMHHLRRALCTRATCIRGHQQR